MEEEEVKDLIERQKVIDEINRHIDSFIAVDKNYLDGMMTAITFIKDVPSAQPNITCKRPVGTWEPLGHRMGVFKHPDSEDYKCSVCGYESYTIYALPPKTCPECGADMRESVKKLYDDIMSVPLPGWEENDD